MCIGSTAPRRRATSINGLSLKTSKVYTEVFRLYTVRERSDILINYRDVLLVFIYIYT